MRNAALIGISIFLLNACTGQSGSVTPKSPEVASDISLPSRVVEISNIQVGDFAVTPDTIDLGQVSITPNGVSQDVVLKNSASSSRPLSLQLEEAPGFRVLINRCGTQIAAQATCKLTLYFSSKDLYNNEYHTGLNINNSVVPVVAQVVNKPDPATGGTPNLSVEFKETNFSGSISNPSRSIILKNSGTGNAKDLQTSVSPEYVLLINRCPSVLGSSKSCSVNVAYRDYKNSSATDSSVLFSFSAPNNELTLKSIATLTGTVSTLPSAYSPVFEASFPASTKTATCSGTETVHKDLVGCKNTFNASVPLSNCSEFELPSLTYQSPAGEFVSSQPITGGELFSSCAIGSTVQVPSRVSCIKPAYFEQADLSCGVESFSGSYAAVSNPVPNACDGTQVRQRPLISGSCVGANNGPAADSYCAATTSQTFISPAGEGSTPETISGGSLFYTCAAGVSSKLANSRVECLGTHLSYGFACYPASASCNMNNGTGSQAFNQSTGTYDSCLATSCGTDHQIYNGTCHRTFASSCVEAKNDGVLNTIGTTASGTYNIRKDSMSYQVTCDMTNNTASTIDASGGTVTYDGNFKIHTFTTSGTFQVISGSGNVQSLIVAGGGGGGSSLSSNGGAGGGGAGGMLESSSTAITVGSNISVVVGAGGSGGVLGAGQNGTNGNNSAFGPLTAVGGGGGAKGNAPSAGAINHGLTGGSGGGGGWNGYNNAYIGTGGSRTVGQGNIGGGTTYVSGDPTTGSAAGAGGGGAGGGGNGNFSYHVGGAGGAGKVSSISGSSVTYAIGGGGGSGSGVIYPTGPANTGSGGSAAYSNYGAGVSGTAGIVIIRYQYKTN